MISSEESEAEVLADGLAELPDEAVVQSCAGIPTVIVRLVDGDPETAWGAARKAELEGFFVEEEDAVTLLVTGNSRRLALFQRHFPGTWQLRDVGGVRCPRFGTLKRLKVSPRKFKAPHIVVAPPTTVGRIGGWAVVPNADWATVKVRIDGEEVGEACANLFREYLLKAGIGLGLPGYSFRPPDDFLDGREHEIEVRLLGNDAICRSIRAVLPFHFNLPRPWIGVAEPDAGATWSAEDQRSYMQVRDRIMYGDRSSDLRSARALVERKPEAIFKDLGVQERYLGRGQGMPTFRNRLEHRWGLHYHGGPCERGLECCKNIKLSYNTSRPISPAAWTEDELLDNCPLRLRHFASKATTKRYAHRMGAITPQDYGVIRSAEEFDAFEFPPSYIMKPDFGSGIGLFLMHGDLNLFDGIRYAKDALRDAVQSHISGRPLARFIVEEFLVQDTVSPELPVIPLDYKLHAFGGKVRLIHVDDRNTVSRDPLHRRQSWLSRDWTESPFRMRITEQSNNPIRRPRCFHKMLEQADTIASDLGDYVRIDMYATEDGPVLGEISTFTHAGVGFTEIGDSILSQAWELFRRSGALPTCMEDASTNVQASDSK